MEPELKLKNGRTVAVIGGGPGGSACAISLVREAERAGLSLRVVLFEGKDFHLHYNQCAGVLSPPLISLLERELEISLPRELIKREIRGYRLHSNNNEILLIGRGEEGPTYTVRRLQFDEFLLSAAIKAGAEVVRSRVSDVEFVGNGRPEEVRVYSESGYVRADCVVGAFGLDEAMLTAFENATRGWRGYERPRKYWRTFITKFHTERGFIERKLWDIIYAFLLPKGAPVVEFGAITPKGDHLVISIAGARVTSKDMDRFLDLPQVRAHLPPFHKDDLLYFGGKFPMAPAKHPFGDRYVMVGDATGWMRPFKGKGINTAIVTGMRAARAMVRGGLSRESLASYARECQELRDDYYFGCAARLFCRWTSNNGLFDRIVELAKTDPAIYDALFDSVSGHQPYKRIMLRNLNWRLIEKAGMVVTGYRVASGTAGRSVGGG